MLKILLLVTVASIGAFAQCPLKFIKIEPLGSSMEQVNRALSQKGEIPPVRFNVKVQNTSGKDIRGLKVQAAYFDATEDLHVIPVAWNWERGVKTAAEKTLSWNNELYANTAFVGWIVAPIKILFEDRTTWQATEPMGDCYGEYWRDKKHPRLTAFPGELLKSPQSVDK
jgi:hypothetical protein